MGSAPFLLLVINCGQDRNPDTYRHDWLPVRQIPFTRANTKNLQLGFEFLSIVGSNCDPRLTERGGSFEVFPCGTSTFGIGQHD